MINVLSEYYKEIKKLRMCRFISEATKQKEIEYLLSKIDEVKAKNKYSRRKKTLLKNVTEKKLVWYATLTLNESKIDKDVKTLKSSMVKLLKRYGINYCLVPEVSPKGRLHFHGFLDLGYVKPKIKKKLNGDYIKDRYGNYVYEIEEYTKNYGWCHLVNMENVPPKIFRKCVNYSCNYSIKGDEKMMSARCDFGIMRMKKIFENLLTIK